MLDFGFALNQQATKAFDHIIWALIKRTASRTQCTVSLHNHSIKHGFIGIRHFPLHLFNEFYKGIPPSCIYPKKKPPMSCSAFPSFSLKPVGAVHHIQETTASALDVLIRTTATGHVSEKPTEQHICNKQGCTSEVPTSQTLYYPALDVQLCFDILCMDIIKRTGDEGRPWKSPTPPLKMMMLDFVQRM